jgi:signal peptidase II
MKYKFCFLTLGVLVLDHVTKWLARTELDPERAIEVIPGYLRISYVSNTGVAFGLFRDLDSPWKPYVLAAMAIVAVVVIFVYSFRMPSSRLLLQSALAVIMGGILGNFVDRILQGYVVDFIEFHIRDKFYWPTFNVADSAITVGIGLLLIDAVKNTEPDEEPQSN